MKCWESSRSADKDAIKKAYRKMARNTIRIQTREIRMLKRSLKKLQKRIMCSVTLRRKTYMISSVMQHLKKALAEPDMAKAALMETAALRLWIRWLGGFGNGHSGAYRSPDGSYQEFHFEGGDMDDILKNLFGGGFGGGSNSGKAGSAHGFGGSGFGHSGFENGSFRSGFNGSFGSGGFDGTGYGDGFGNSCNSGFSGSHQQKGQDLNAEISISFNEAAFGCDKLINLSGADGSGKQTLKVHIPAGIDNGKSIRLRGKGNPGYGGAPAGDLLLKVHVGERLALSEKAPTFTPP